MRALAQLLLCASLLGGCALLEPRPAPLGREEIVRMAKAGESPQDIIRKLDETQTVFLLSASEILRLHDDGVPREVLDYMQQIQIDAIRRREAAFQSFYGFSPYGPLWACPFPVYRPYPYGWRRGPFPPFC